MENPAFSIQENFIIFGYPSQHGVTEWISFARQEGIALPPIFPWLIHEPKEGMFVLKGEEYLDVEDFFITAQEAGLRVIARPGPYQYSELVYGGLPKWLYDDYPELHAKRINGDSLYPGSVSYLHPVFLERGKTLVRDHLSASGQIHDLPRRAHRVYAIRQRGDGLSSLAWQCRL